MGDLLWPGDERAGELFGQPALLAAMVRVEAAWLAALVEQQVAPEGAYDDLTDLVTASDVPLVAEGAGGSGNPVVPLVSLLRDRLQQRNTDAARWLHRGLTSQDVLDTSLSLCLRDVLDRVAAELATQRTTLVELADAHRETLMAGRTLTQPAVPITFGVKAASWLDGLVDAARSLAEARQELPAQLGGAAGTMAAATELADVDRAPALVRTTVRRLDLQGGLPWHGNRGRVTRTGDALVRCTDAWGRIANDVLTLSRPELGELSERSGGGSSTMPHKANPVLSVLVRRAALAGPLTAAQLHLAAADTADERPAGAWHLEWSALRDLARRAVVAASQTTDVLTGLQVHPERMKDNLAAALPGVLAEQRAMAELVSSDSTDRGTDDDPAGYLGLSSVIIDTAIERARRQS
ncbi:MAG TPA: lyase family protein [Marmoricola sp.]|nr:lyase family protein [Marmoricola sp.]